MGKGKKDLNETKIKFRILSDEEEAELEKKVHAVVNFLQKKVPNPRFNLIHSTGKIIFLLLSFIELRLFYEAHSKSKEENSFRGKYKSLLKALLVKRTIPAIESILDLRDECRDLCLQIPDDRLMDSFYALLTLPDELIKDTENLLLFFQIMVFYYWDVERSCSDKVKSKMDTIALRLMRQAYHRIIEINREGRTFDRTTRAKEMKKKKYDEKRNKIRQIYIRWLNDHQEHRKLGVKYKKFSIAKEIKSILSDTKDLEKISSRKIVEIMEVYHSEKGSNPPWE